MWALCSIIRGLVLINRKVVKIILIFDKIADFFWTQIQMKGCALIFTRLNKKKIRKNSRRILAKYILELELKINIMIINN